MRRLTWVWLAPVFVFDAVRAYVAVVASPVFGRGKRPIPGSFPRTPGFIRARSGDRGVRP